MVSYLESSIPNRSQGLKEGLSGGGLGIIPGLRGASCVILPGSEEEDLTENSLCSCFTLSNSPD